MGVKYKTPLLLGSRSSGSKVGGILVGYVRYGGGNGHNKDGNENEYKFSDN